MNIKSSVIRHYALPSYLILGCLLGLSSVLTPRFFTPFNISNVLLQVAALGIASLGLTFIVLSGSFDLSIGAVISLTVTLATYVIRDSVPGIIVGIFFCLLVGTLVGVANGVLIARLRLIPIIATFGMYSVLRGVALFLRPIPSGTLPRDFTEFLMSSLGPVPRPVIIWIVLTLIALFVLYKTVFAVHVYATGGNEESAHRSGINILFIRISVHVIGSLLAAIAGLVMAARIGSGDATIGEAFMLDSVTAVAIGNTALTGGRGGIEGTVAGVLIIGILSNILNLVGISPFYQYLLKGLILVMAVAMTTFKKPLI